MDVDGTGLRRLTDGANNGANNGDPVWSPDGARITFGSDREGGSKLNVFAMNADGSGAGHHGDRVQRRRLRAALAAAVAPGSAGSFYGVLPAAS